MNALQSAAKRGDADFVKRRLEEMTSLDLNISDVNGNSLLHQAARFGHMDTVLVLCQLSNEERPLIADWKNNEGRTALDLANQFGHAEVAGAIKHFINSRQGHQMTIAYQTKTLSINSHTETPQMTVGTNELTAKIQLLEQEKWKLSTLLKQVMDERDGYERIFSGAQKQAADAKADQEAMQKVLEKHQDEYDEFVLKKQDLLTELQQTREALKASEELAESFKQTFVNQDKHAKILEQEGARELEEQKHHFEQLLSQVQDEHKKEMDQRKKLQALVGTMGEELAELRPWKERGAVAEKKCESMTESMDVLKGTVIPQLQQQVMDLTVFEQSSVETNAKLEEMRAALAEKTDAMEELKKTEAGLRAKLEEEMMGVAKIRQELAASKEDAMLKGLTVSSVSDTLNTANKKIESLQCSLEEYKENLRSSDQITQELSKRVDDSRQSAQQEKQDFVDKIRTLQETIRYLGQESETHKTMIKEATDSVATHEATLKERNAAIGAMSLEKLAMSSDLQSQRAQISMLVAKLTSLEDSDKETKDKLALTVAEKEALAVTMTNLEHDLRSELKLLSSSLQQEKLNLIKEVEKSADTNEDLKKTKASLETEQQTLAETRDRLEGERVRHQQMMTKQDVEIHRLRTQADTLKGQVHDLKAQVHNLKAELEAQKEQLLAKDQDTNAKLEAAAEQAAKDLASAEREFASKLAAAAHSHESLLYEKELARRAAEAATDELKQQLGDEAAQRQQDAKAADEALGVARAEKESVFATLTTLNESLQLKFEKLEQQTLQLALSATQIINDSPGKPVLDEHVTPLEAVHDLVEGAASRIKRLQQANDKVHMELLDAKNRETQWETCTRDLEKQGESMRSELQELRKANEVMEHQLQEARDLFRQMRKEVQTTKYALQKEQEDNQELQATINRTMKSHQSSSKTLSSGNQALVPVSQSTASGSQMPLQATTSSTSLRGLSADEGEEKVANDSPSFLDTLGPKGM